MYTSPSLTHRVREGQTCPAGIGRGKMSCRDRKGETCIG